MKALSVLTTAPSSSTTDLVFEALANAVITLELPPGSKVSEVDIAKRLGVSRQPVRDAFFRLSQQGFLSIRPQRASLISKISERAVREAVFVRTAIEVACIKDLIDKITDEEIEGLRGCLEDQQEALDRDSSNEFHALDRGFHQRICEISGRFHVWKLIQEKKAHMDRVRALSLPGDAQTAFNEHLELFETLKSRQVIAAENSMSHHIGRILQVMSSVRNRHDQYFEDE